MSLKKDFEGNRENGIIVAPNWLLFSNGDQQEISSKAIMTTIIPHRLAKLKLLYWQSKLQLAVDEFTVHKNHLHNYCSAQLGKRSCGNPPNEAALEKLKVLKKKVDGLLPLFNMAEENLEANRDPREIKREIEETEIRKECEDFLDELDDIQIDI